jgi:hypothetical protein
MREIVERDPQEGDDSENLDDVGAACHRYNSNLRDADIVHGADSWRPFGKCQRFGAPIGFSTLKPDVSAEDAAGIGPAREKLVTKRGRDGHC